MLLAVPKGIDTVASAAREDIEIAPKAAIVIARRVAMTPALKQLTQGAKLYLASPSPLLYIHLQ
jgi:hypothetical protein